MPQWKYLALTIRRPSSFSFCSRSVTLSSCTRMPPWSSTSTQSTSSSAAGRFRTTTRRLWPAAAVWFEVGPAIPAVVVVPLPLPLLLFPPVLGVPLRLGSTRPGDTLPLLALGWLLEGKLGGRMKLARGDGIGAALLSPALCLFPAGADPIRRSLEPFDPLLSLAALALPVGLDLPPPSPLPWLGAPPTLIPLETSCSSAVSTVSCRSSKALCCSVSVEWVAMRASCCDASFSKRSTRCPADPEEPVGVLLLMCPLGDGRSFGRMMGGGVLLPCDVVSGGSDFCSRRLELKDLPRF